LLCSHTYKSQRHILATQKHTRSFDERLHQTGDSYRAFVDLRFLNAETIYETGFEKQTYSTGSLSGHNGWTSTGGSIGVIEKTFAYSGSQAVLYDTSARAGQYDDIYNFSYNSINNPNQLVTLSVEAYFTGDSNEIWEALGPDSSIGFMGQIQVQDGYATFGLADTNIGAVPVTFNSWNPIQHGLRLFHRY
jgi:hypothetical protein